MNAEFLETKRKADKGSNWHRCPCRKLDEICQSTSTSLPNCQSNRLAKIEAHFQMMLESGPECDNNLPTMGLFDHFKLVREESILGVEIGMSVAIFFRFYNGNSFYFCSLSVLSKRWIPISITDSPEGLCNCGKYAPQWYPDQSLVHKVPNDIQSRPRGSHHGQRPGLFISWQASTVPNL